MSFSSPQRVAQNILIYFEYETYQLKAIISTKKWWNASTWGKANTILKMDQRWDNKCKRALKI